MRRRACFLMCLVAAAGLGCQTDPAVDGAGGAVGGALTVTVPASGTTLRVGGDTTIAVRVEDGNYRADVCLIDTPLPEGYPPPTPPGAIDIKTYPSVRLAEVSGTGNPDRGMNTAFWSLFRHIKKHDIAMTSPVEMSYGGDESAPWTMAFLYRTASLNETGPDGGVLVRDAEPMTVLSIGLKGDYSMKLVERGMTELEDWLAAHPEWTPAGNWRSLYYNGPQLMFWNKWAEVQIPIRPKPPAPVQ